MTVLASLLFTVSPVSAQQTPVDETFHTDVSGTVNRVVVQNDGKLIIGGDFQTVNGQTTLNLARLSLDGSVDAGFLLDGSCTTPVRFVSILSDGRIVCQGSVQHVNGEVFGPVFRLNTNGSIDLTFRPFAGLEAHKIAVQSDGKVIYSFQAPPYLGRLNTDGSRDTTFQGAFAYSAAIEAGVDSLAIQSDGKILAGGTFNTTAGSENLVRLNQDGSLDPSYTGNPGPLLYVYHIFLQPDGKAIISGKSSPDYGAPPLFRRLNPDRGIDPTFLGDGQSLSVAAQSGDSLYTRGHQFLRLHSDGSMDNTFSIQLGGGFVSSVAIQSDGKLVAGGSFSSINGESHNNIVRLNTNDTPSAALAFKQPHNEEDRFCTTIFGVVGQRYVIEASTDFTNWNEIALETATESGIKISYPRAELPNPCFIRARLANN